MQKEHGFVEIKGKPEDENFVKRPGGGKKGGINI